MIILILMLLLSNVVARLPKGVYEVALDEEAKHKLFWDLDYGRSTIKFEVHALLKEKEWFAVGFSDRGAIENGDFCVYERRHGNPGILGVWTDDKGIAHEFPAEQNLCGEFNYVESDVAKFTFTRPFQACFPYHYQIEDGTTHVVWSRGSGPVLGRRLYGRTEDGMTRVQLLKTEGVAAPHPPSTWVFRPTMSRTKVPPTDTTYWCQTLKLPPAFRRKNHIIQAASYLTKGNEGLVHHMELFHCELPSDHAIQPYAGLCDKKPTELRACSKVMAAWAMGATPFVYPREAGFPVGGPDYGKYAMLEIHYNNPSKSADWIDSSGFEIYLTTNLREYDAGVIELGLEYVDKMAIPPKLEQFSLSGYCISECTNSALPDDGIFVFGSQLHTHLTGIMVETRHFRDGVELPMLNYDYHYSPHFQEIRLLKKEVNVKPGDALITTCYYNTMERDNITLGGFATTDEMCVNYIYYYPKIELEVCKSSISDDILGAYFDSLKRLERQATGSDLPISAAYQGINWTPLRVNILDDLYKESTIYMQCNDSAGRRFPGDWSHMPLPTRKQSRLRDANVCFDDVGEMPT